MISIPVSVGELVDKITILQIKTKNISDENKLINVNNELEKLQLALQSIVLPDLTSQFELLYYVNSRLWYIEDKLREKELKKQFDNSFIALARLVYQLNDRRAEIKKEINIKTGSGLIEEKSYM